jgi:hypothetical protein
MVKLNTDLKVTALFLLAQTQTMPMTTEFGLAVASVVCFLAILWYGVDFVLGKGLHSYGFDIAGETYVATFIIRDILFLTFAIWRY